MKFVETNGIKLAYIDHPGPGETLVLSHGLTANAHFFGGLIKAGLNAQLRVIAVDLRGRGQSDKPATGYAMADHAADLIGLLDALGLDQVLLGGHSFGGMLTLFTAANYPDRVKKLVVIDAAAVVARVEIVEAIKPSLDRLEKTMPSLEAYISAMKQAPYYHDGFWDESLEEYYRNDVEVLADGSVKPLARPDAMKQAIDAVLAEDWFGLFAKIRQPAILLNAPHPFGPPGAPTILSKEGALETVNALADCSYYEMAGHHISMLFGENAGRVARTIHDFVNA